VLTSSFYLGCFLALSFEMTPLPFFIFFY
jgi:hypothetical protein